jgi:sporulation protein YlmC with PRC-barrel domain
MSHKFFTIGAAALVLGLGLAPVTSGFMVAPAHAAGGMVYSTETEMKTLLGQDIKNAAGETVGDVESVYVDKNGKISAVIVGVGGFLGVGEREVAINWSDITVSNDGKTITTRMTKDQLKAMPAYNYKQATWRGTVFRD